MLYWKLGWPIIVEARERMMLSNFVIIKPIPVSCPLNSLYSGNFWSKLLVKLSVFTNNFCLFVLCPTFLNDSIITFRVVKLSYKKMIYYAGPSTLESSCFRQRELLKSFSEVQLPISWWGRICWTASFIFKQVNPSCGLVIIRLAA